MDRRVSVLIASALLALGIIAYMLFRAWGDILASMGHWIPVYLLPATAFCTAGWLLRGFRYRSILRGLEVRAGFWFSTACVLISQTVNLVVPARLGDLVRIFILKHEGLCDYPTGLSSLVIERFFDVLTVAILGLVALPFIPGVPSWVFPIIVIPIGLCIAFVVILLAFGRIESGNKYIAILLSMIREMKKASLTP
ncbi:MAG TPA: lysylphosphatidylglycerol synthase transmembrane domain-containing protein, partial [Methanomicrobiales archaeon]|nr:lysylphosphatidylglycerol synthase transmembrane domain-containing protein [Methanomicrobiales archaeon]